MKINLDKISEWTFPGFKLGSLAYQYAPINAKNHFARGKVYSLRISVTK